MAASGGQQFQWRQAQEAGAPVRPLERTQTQTLVAASEWPVAAGSSRSQLSFKSTRRRPRVGEISKRNNSTSNSNNNDYIIQSSQPASSSRSSRRRSQFAVSGSSRRRRRRRSTNERDPFKMSLYALLLFAFVALVPGGQRRFSGGGGGDDDYQLSSSRLPPFNQPAFAFNLDPQSATVHKGPEGSYFGFSVAQHRDRQESWLLVGAPRAQTNQNAVKLAGAVYKCSPTYSTSCQQVVFDPNGSSPSEDKTLQGFGSTVQSATENGSIVACAPRYVYMFPMFKKQGPIGTCRMLDSSFNGSRNYSPCKIDAQWGHHHLGSCEAGFSSAITKDGSRLIMGAPGAHVWQGQVFSHNLKTDLSNSTSAVNPHSEDDSYIGYSLALGRFSSGASSPASGRRYSSSSSSSSPPPPDNSDLAIGIPRGADLMGKVMIVDREMRTLRNITGEQMGAYFGYSLLTADVNGDGLDDLLISAPLYYNASRKEPHFERGRVYVALQTAGHDFNIAQRLDGQRNRARFGTSMANCGDLNRDGIQDVAIGAPFDGPDNRGAVHIFMGKKGGLSEEPDQTIYAESIRNEGNHLRSFGFSLSAGLDVDGNGYPDLLVGDYQADRAVSLRARPIVNVTSRISFQPENFNLDNKTCLLPNSNTPVSCITVEYCLKYNGQNTTSRLPIVYDIKLDTENKGAPRMFFLNDHPNTATLIKDEEKCRSFKAYLMQQIRDKLTPLKVDIDYNLAPTNDDYSSSSSSSSILKPIINKSAGNKLSKVATIQKNCGRDNVCVPDLRIYASANVEQYRAGSNEKIIINVTVRNNGEDAFESMFYLKMPMSINYNGIDKMRSDFPVCFVSKPDQTGENVLTCDLGNPQAANEVVKFAVITEPAKDAYSNLDYTFVASVNSTNPEQDADHLRDNEAFIGIPIKVDVDLALTGKAEPPLIGFNTTLSASKFSKPKVNEADIGPEVYHIYNLKNTGPITLNDIALTILWPTKNKEGQYLLYLVDEPITSDNVRCKPAPDGAINGLNLRISRPLNNSTDGYFTNRNAPVGSRIRYSQSSSTNNYNQQQQQEDLSNSTSTTIDESALERLLTTNCGPTQCTRFECNVYDLASNGSATIKIRSRLYEDTINYQSLQDFEISSRLVAQIKSIPYNVSSQTWREPYVHEVYTNVHTTGLAVQDLLPWWLILLAVLLGIALFVLLVCFLKWLGFFARKRPPKGAEREPLTPTAWNDYHYTPGDTAL